MNKITRLTINASLVTSVLAFIIMIYFFNGDFNQSISVVLISITFFLILIAKISILITGRKSNNSKEIPVTKTNYEFKDIEVPKQIFTGYER